MEALQQELEEMRTLVADLRTAVTSAEGQNGTERNEDSGVLRNLKAPPIPVYSGKKDERTTVKVNGFVYNVRKVGALSNMNDAKLLAMAECHLQDKAAAWIMRCERAGTKPTTVAELQAAMIKEFVPADEKARAKMDLMNIEMKASMDAHIAKFQELVEICSTPLSEAYLFFFMSLQPNYKQEFTKKYPTGEPESMQEVYEHARTLELSMKWTKSNKESIDKNALGKKKKESLGDPSTKKPKKDEDLCWGPAKRHEIGLYKKKDRCMKCGLAGWSKPGHRDSCKGNPKADKDDPKA